jgi:hypothetical protein
LLRLCNTLGNTLSPALHFPLSFPLLQFLVLAREDVPAVGEGSQVKAMSYSPSLLPAPQFAPWPLSPGSSISIGKGRAE